MKRCPVTNKRKFRDKITCLVAHAYLPFMAHAYRCPHCKYWHVTSRGQH